MALVDYSSDSSDANNAQKSQRKRKRQSSPSSTVRDSLPPLPSSFLDLYSTSVRTSTVDDPSLHGGRQRATSHLKGNWPTHIYTEWYPSQTETTIITRLIGRYSLASASYAKGANEDAEKINPLLKSSLGAPLPLHISLSRSLSLDTTQRENFPERLTAAVEKSDIRPFSIAPTYLRWVPNYPRTRWFLVLQLGRPKDDKLNRLLKTCNGVVNTFGLSGLYEGGAKAGAGNLTGPPAPGEDTDQTIDIRAAATPAEEDGKNERNNDDPFHVSIAWTLSEPKPNTPKFQDGADQESLSNELQKLQVPINAVKVKVGNNLVNIPLERDRQQDEAKGRKRWLGQ